MNEAKKKADELVSQFKDAHYTDISETGCIHCALITVNEVLKAYPTEPSESNSIYDQLEQAPKYWEEVKKELESRL
jgi:hypothetical protein